MISAEKYVENYYGDKDAAIANLEKWLKLYEESSKSQTPKVVKRLEDYRLLLSEIKKLN